jgi:hypothetical protein
MIKPELNPFKEIVFQIGIGADDAISDGKAGLISKT